MGLTQNWLRSSSERSLATRIWKIYAVVSLAGLRHRPLLRLSRRDHRILDVGCGGGIPWLADYGKVTGVDCVPALLEKARQYYAHTVCHDIGQPFPLESGAFDLAVMNDVVAHVDDATMRACIAEMSRLLTKGSQVIAAMECDNDGLLFRMGRSVPEVFRRNYIDKPGHHFLRKLEENHALFAQGGFYPVHCLYCSGCPGDLSSLIPDGSVLPRRSMRWLVFLDRCATSWRVSRELLQVAWNPINSLVANARNSSLVICTYALR